MRARGIRLDPICPGWTARRSESAPEYDRRPERVVLRTPVPQFTRRWCAPCGSAERLCDGLVNSHIGRILSAWRGLLLCVRTLRMTRVLYISFDAYSSRATCCGAGRGAHAIRRAMRNDHLAVPTGDRGSFSSPLDLRCAVSLWESRAVWGTRTQYGTTSLDSRPAHLSV